MLNVFICEDNLNHRNEILKYVNNTIIIEDLSMKLALATSDPNDILNSIKNSKTTNLYFLDVDLKSDINGIQLAEKIREYDPRGFIVFITTHAEMSYLTFLYKVEAIDFIIKDNFNEVSKRISECILNAYKKFSSLSNSIPKVFIVKNGDRLLNFELDKIIFFETSTTIHKVKLYTENTVIEFYGQLKEIEGLLDSRFCRCHQSFIINKNYIKEINTTKRIVIMSNNSECFVSIRGMKVLCS
ncbi:MAG: LytR/AlgR family response regulator transcription factor [Clostridium sp.]